MKKFLALVLTLALALSFSVTAFAEDTTIQPGTDGAPTPNTAQTDVVFSVAPTYTITIPTKVQLSRNEAADGTVTYRQEAKITASEKVRLLNGQVIQVTLSAGTDGFVLTSDEKATLDYTVTVGESTTPIASGDPVATFDTSLEAQDSTLHFAANDPVYAGEYSDEVTFNIAIKSKDTTNP